MQTDTMPLVSEEKIQRFENDGAIMLPGLFGGTWVERMRTAVERVLKDSHAVDSGGFTRNRNMWLRDRDFRAFVFESPAAEIAKAMMRCSEINFYFDHLFVKEPGTESPTPWHQDRPYWPVAGGEVVSIWLALDEVSTDTSGLTYAKGTHRAGKVYRPVGFSDGKIAEQSDVDEPMPDIDGNPSEFTLLSWDMKPGDCLVHSSLVVHGAAGNRSTTQRRRALSTRWAARDVIFDPHPGSDRLLTEVNLKPGQPLSGEKHPLFR
jgi:ectoine hydroxylase-related dioxygenase (phytanoyl-CoA dioxygenase family)